MSIQKGRTPMRKVLLTLATLTLSVLIGGDLTIYASDIESENNVIQIYEKIWKQEKKLEKISPFQQMKIF